MRIVRNTLSVVIGYLIFAVSAMMLFSLSGIDPHADATLITMALVIAFGAAFALIGGYVCKLIAVTKALIANYVLALLMGGFAAFSFIKSPGSHYTQIAAILIFAPLSLVGGYIADQKIDRS